MFNLIKFLLLLTMFIKVRCSESPWHWECVSGYCQKRLTDANDDQDKVLSLAACRLTCSEYAALWPKPTGQFQINPTLVNINPNTIEIISGRSVSSIVDLITSATINFKFEIEQLIPKQARLKPYSNKKLVVYLMIDDTTTRQLKLDTDESYELKINENSDGNINATIISKTYFGSRNGMETLGQLIIYDDLHNNVIMPNNAYIKDKPAYPYRGILLDTSRNYVDVDTIKRTINAMGASKLNRLHWHITDSHSFPYVSPSQPNLSKYGAYSPNKLYRPNDVEEIIQFGLERGVQIVPEFDAPAHVGEGWQTTNLLVCFNAQPWQNYCVEPPCGQFDPTKPELYDILESIYGDMLAQFQPDIFHMGGDEVHFGCWNSSNEIVEWMASQGWGRTGEDFIKLWNHFQTEAANRVYKKAGKEIPLVMWTSTLTENPNVLKYLPNDKYIIQIWTTGSDPQVSNLLRKGYHLILSNYDALYFDCGFAGWVTDGNNWCSPYKGWQKIYENKPVKIAGERKKQILGAEATLWTEQADSAVIDSRLWPRAAALSEVLWSEPETTWRQAEQRFLVHRERLVARGVQADTVEPEWCLQYEENCPIGGKEWVPVSPDNSTDTSVVSKLDTTFLLVNFIILQFFL